MDVQDTQDGTGENCETRGTNEENSEPFRRSPVAADVGTARVRLGPPLGWRKRAGANRRASQPRGRLVSAWPGPATSGPAADGRQPSCPSCLSLSILMIRSEIQHGCTGYTGWSKGHGAKGRGPVRRGWRRWAISASRYSATERRNSGGGHLEKPGVFVIVPLPLSGDIVAYSACRVFG